MIGPDPLKISQINPLDFKYVGGEMKLVPGWWKNIKSEKEKMFEELKEKYKKK